MKCTGCGVELIDDVAFCPYCGAKNEHAQEQVVNESPAAVENVMPEDKKVWQVFAKLAFIFAIVNIVSSGIGFLTSFSLIAGAFGILLSSLALELGIPGIVFSVLGRKSPSSQSKAKKALIMNIISVAVATLACFIYGVVIGINSVENGDFDNIYLTQFMVR